MAYAIVKQVFTFFQKQGQNGKQIKTETAEWFYWASSSASVSFKDKRRETPSEPMVTP